MHEEQNNAPVEAVQGNRQEVYLPNLEETGNLKQYYLALSRRLCPTIPVDSSDLRRLGALHHKIKRFIKALSNLDRPWEKGMPEIQKSCLNSLISQTLSKAERQKLQNEWLSWSDFLISASFHRGYITQILQEYYRQLHDIEKILDFSPSAIPEELSSL